MICGDSKFRMIFKNVPSRPSNAFNSQPSMSILIKVTFFSISESKLVTSIWHDPDSATALAEPALESKSKGAYNVRNPFLNKFN